MSEKESRNEFQYMGYQVEFKRVYYTDGWKRRRGWSDLVFIDGVLIGTVSLVCSAGDQLVCTDRDGSPLLYKGQSRREVVKKYILDQLVKNI